MNINELTLGQVQKLRYFFEGGNASSLSPSTSAAAFDVGDKIYARTITYAVVGEIIELRGFVAVLKDASWIADTNLLSDMLEDGIKPPAEVERIPDVTKWRVNLEALVDGGLWPHTLPVETIR